ncbi:amidase family protein [uncultured Psychroserpens sp.]|uniref:amidase family protein n=1 Tax=uncultured Psychroserpens sp. TaxID=255436 RepID=UPI0026057557|nr:amidase family protein [uncultured Psychroserpens sp.]
MRFIFLFCLILITYNCKPSNEKKTSSEDTQAAETANDSDDLSDISTKDFREFKVLDSKYINTTELWDVIDDDLKDFNEDDYFELKPLILDQDIPSLQKHISEGLLSYESLTKFYLYRIKKFDRENELSLNSVIAINPNVIKQAIARDKLFQEDKKKYKHPIYGMPILLKDNINTSEMPTTAGSVALKDNTTEDAFIVKQLKSKGALILGKANLSEWAYFFCGDCPSGYSAIGGQTLNPYGRRIIDTGGSSSGSGVAVAANFCVAAIGSETSGSILSPSSQNSVVGLKPTIGLVSRSGIVPISSTLDTAGPMTKNVMDNAIVLDAIFGFDNDDSKSINTKWGASFYYGSFGVANKLNNKRFGAFKGLMEDELYANAVEVLKSQGAEIIEIEALDVNLPGFLRLLNLDMKVDLVNYLKDYGNPYLKYTSIEDIMDFNRKDSMRIMPYGQKLFQGISDDSATDVEFAKIKSTLKINGKRFFDEHMTAHNLDGVLSINNYHAGFAAVAEYPALTVPMGYAENGAPKGLTLISSPLREIDLLNWARVYEQASKKRKAPANYN